MASKNIVLVNIKQNSYLFYKLVSILPLLIIFYIVSNFKNLKIKNSILP